MGKTKRNDLISIIVPCYNEEKALPEFYRATTQAVKEINNVSYEFIFIDDGSSDGTSDLLQSLSQTDNCCRYLSFSRNFGKEAAMYAGLKNASGDYCVFMDADLQHPPSLLKEMYRAVSDEGYDCCGGLREDRTGENPVRTILSQTFYHVISKICHLDMGDGKGDFRMMNRAMTDSVLELKEYNRYMKGIFSFVGYNTKWVPFHNTARIAGKTKWSIGALFRYAADGILSFSSAPSVLAGTAGISFILISLLLCAFMLLSGQGFNGTQLIACLILLLGGFQMCFLSVLAQYMAKEYMEAKHRPIYIIKKRGGF